MSGVCSPAEEFEADAAYTSNSLCARIARLEREVVELRGDSALDRAYQRALASWVYEEQQKTIDALRAQVEDLQRQVVEATQATRIRSQQQ